MTLKGETSLTFPLPRGTCGYEKIPQIPPGTVFSRYEFERGRVDDEDSNVPTINSNYPSRLI